MVAAYGARHKADVHKAPDAVGSSATWRPFLAYETRNFPRSGRGGGQRRRHASVRVEDRMKVLVTGHHGYIGSVLAPVIADAGHEVTGVDTFFYEGCDFVPDLGPVTSVRGDVRDLEVDDLVG